MTNSGQMDMPKKPSRSKVPGQSLEVPSLFPGDKVEKVGGDYCFRGYVVASFWKISGVRRVVVENGDGILHIFSERNLTIVKRFKPKREKFRKVKIK